VIKWKRRKTKRDEDEIANDIWIQEDETFIEGIFRGISMTRKKGNKKILKYEEFWKKHIDIISLDERFQFMFIFCCK
jgi:hypothetical protein